MVSEFWLCFFPLFVVFAVCANISIAGVVFWFSDPIIGVLGKAGSKAISKLAAFLLAPIAVTMVRRGLMMVLAGS